MSLRIHIRSAEPADIPKLIVLMRELAIFENYFDRFAVTEEQLQLRGFPKEGEPQFFALLAEDTQGILIGYAVYYLVAFTFDLRPTLVLKELWVRARYRGQGAGRQLLDQLLTTARVRRCGKISWAVLPSNTSAKSFYRAWGGRPDENWEYWNRPLEQGASDPLLPAPATTD